MKNKYLDNIDFYNIKFYCQRYLFEPYTWFMLTIGLLIPAIIASCAPFHSKKPKWNTNFHFEIKFSKYNRIQEVLVLSLSSKLLIDHCHFGVSIVASQPYSDNETYELCKNRYLFLTFSILNSVYFIVF